MTNKTRREINRMLAVARRHLGYAQANPTDRLSRDWRASAASKFNRACRLTRQELSS